MSDEMEAITVRVPKAHGAWYRELFRAVTAPPDGQIGLIQIAYTHGEGGQRMRVTKFNGNVENYGQHKLPIAQIASMLGAHIAVASGELVDLSDRFPELQEQMMAAAMMGSDFVQRAQATQGSTFAEVLEKMPPGAFGNGGAL